MKLTLLVGDRKVRLTLVQAWVMARLGYIGEEVLHQQ